MSARDLVGRPLVPFFDAEDNVNEALQVDMATQAQEQLDVDARVWDRELGYFVYPNEDANTSQRAHAHAHSQPIAIKKTNASSAPATATADAAGSYGKLLLTPDMLSRSAPSNHSSGMEQMQNNINHNHAATASANNSRAATPRSASAKRSSRQKSRSSTPNKSRNKQQSPPSGQTQGQPSDGGSSGGEDRTTGSDGSEKGKGKKYGKNGEPGSAKKTRNKQQQQQHQTPKSKDELSGNGKWAWSAFQSSPDPKSLPLPPFVAGSGISPGAGALPPPLDPPKIEERLDPPPPVLLDRPPSVPPDAPPLASIEHSMTQDLRRMLNIGS